MSGRDASTPTDALSLLKTATQRVQPTMSNKYNESSSFQRKLNLVARPHLCAAMASLAKRTAAAASESGSSPPPPRIAVADFGCSEGANAVEQMSAAVAAAFEAFEKEGDRGKAPLSISVTHSDLTNNGWNAVASAIAAAGPSYANPPSVVALMQPSDRGFYQRCFPDESLDLVHGAITFHWASRGFRKIEGEPSQSSYDSLPSKLEDACILPGLSSDAGVQALAAEASRGDWKTILAHRARELKSGGFFVAALVCTEPSDSICALWRVLARCLNELVDAGTITQREASEVVVPVHLRMPRDHLAALLLEGGGGEEEDQFLSKAFRVVADEFEAVQAPERDAFLLQEQEDDDVDASSKKYAAGVAAFFEAVSRTMVEAALSPRLGKERATEVADELYSVLFAAKVAESRPEFSIGLQTLVLEKL